MHSVVLGDWVRARVKEYNLRGVSYGQIITGEVPARHVLFWDIFGYLPDGDEEKVWSAFLDGAFFGARYQFFPLGKKNWDYPAEEGLEMLWADWFEMATERNPEVSIGELALLGVDPEQRERRNTVLFEREIREEEENSSLYYIAKILETSPDLEVQDVINYRSSNRARTRQESF